MQRARGFTLLELMLVVAIVGILATLAVGMTTDWRERNDLREDAREIYTLLNRARGAAIKAGESTVVELLAGDTPPRAQAFVDRDLSRSYSSGTDTLVASYAWHDSDTVLADADVLAANGTGSGNTGFVIFDSQGFFVDATGQPLQGSLIAKNTTTNRTLVVRITVAGALRIE